MTHTSTEQPSLAAIIRDLRESHARTSPGAWGKGATTHETVSRAEGLAPYKVAEFRHANDAQFCDLAHVFVPRLLSEIEALQSRVNELEAQLSATTTAQEGWCDGCSPDNCCGCGPVQPKPSMEVQHE